MHQQDYYRHSSFNAVNTKIRILGLRKTALQEEYISTKVGKWDFLTSKVHFLSKVCYKENALDGITQYKRTGL